MKPKRKAQPFNKPKPDIQRPPSYLSLSVNRGRGKPRLFFLDRFEASGLANGITNQTQYRDAKEMLAGIKELKAEALKVYQEMLEPINKRRGVILEWKAEDLETIDRIDAELSTHIRTYSEDSEQEQEAMAAIALEELESSPDPIATAGFELNPAPSPLTEYKKYSAKLVDDTQKTKLAVVKSVADGIISPEALKIDMAWVNAIARRQKENFDLPNFDLVVVKMYKRKAGAV